MRNWMAAWTVGAMLAGASVLSAEETAEAAAALDRHAPCDRPREPVAHRARRRPGPRHRRLPRRRPRHGLVVGAVEARGGQECGPTVDRCPPRDRSPRHGREEMPRGETLASESVLGIAISGASTARGRIAYIFYHRIERIAVLQQTLLRARARPRHGPRDWPPADRRQQSFRRGFDAGELESPRKPAADVHDEPGAADPSPVHGDARVKGDSPMPPAPSEMRIALILVICRPVQNDDDRRGGRVLERNVEQEPLAVARHVVLLPKRGPGRDRSDIRA